MRCLQQQERKLKETEKSGETKEVLDMSFLSAVGRRLVNWTTPRIYPLNSCLANARSLAAGGELSFCWRLMLPIVVIVSDGGVEAVRSKNTRREPGNYT